MNSFIRFKLCLTESTPTIKPYHEGLWAKTIDTQIPIQSSLLLLEGLHERWITLLHGLKGSDLDKSIKHPEHGRLISLREQIGLYAWHGNHHLAHIELAKRNQSLV